MRCRGTRTVHGPSQNLYASSRDVFVAKLSPGGSRLEYATYLGGASDEEVRAIAVDGAGNAYVTGFTYSADFPVLNSMFPQRHMDAFVVKLSPAGSLAYSTRFGGSHADEAAGIAVDAAGAAYICGRTYSSDLPTRHAVQVSLLNPSGSGFVAKLSATGAEIVYATYLGAASFATWVEDIAVDSHGSAVVTGSAPPDFPLVNPVPGTENGFGSGDAFVAKFDPSGSALVYSTLLGGTFAERGNAVAVDSVGNAWVAGTTWSSDCVSLNPLQADPDEGYADAFVAKLGPGGALLFSSHLGGFADDSGEEIAVDGAGNAYVAGWTAAVSFPTVEALGNDTDGHLLDAFVTKISAEGESVLFSTYVGGYGTDYGYALAVDSSGSAYVAGQTYSADFPLESPLQPNHAVHAVANDAFVTKIAVSTRGRDTVGVYQPQDGAWFLRNTNTAGFADEVFAYGLGGVGWQPIAGDFDGDGDDTVGLYDAGTGFFFLRQENGPGPADATLSYGAPNLTALVGDWDSQ